MMTDCPNPEDLLKDAGLRLTQARVAIMACLLGSGTHPSTDELGQILRDKGQALPAATLYQSLEKLTGAGLLTRFSGPDGQVHYDANRLAHHHLICLVCHRVLDVTMEHSLASLRIIDDRTGEPVENWTLENASIELKGICPACRASR